MKTIHLLLGTILSLQALTFPPIVHAAQPPSIEIGVVVPLTGGWGVWGSRVRDALTLSSERLNPAVRLSFDYQDEGTCDAGKAVNGYRYLRASKDVRVVIVGCMNSARAILPLAKRENVLLLSAGFQERDLFEQDASIINLALQIDSEAALLAQSIEQAGVKRLGLIRSAGTDDLIRTMTRHFQKTGTVTVALDQPVTGDESDFSTILLALRKREIDGLYLNLAEPQLITVMKHLNSLRVRPRLFSTYGIEGLAASRPEIQHLASELSYTHPKLSDAYSEFRKVFQERFNVQPTFVTTAFLFDGMERFAQALIQCAGDSSETACLYDQLTDGQWHDGFGGSYCIHSDGSIERNFEIRKLGKQYQ